MLAGATSFILHFQSFIHKKFIYWKSTSFKIFIIIITLAITAVTLNIIFFYKSDISLLHALRIASFQVISLITTTGFATEDFKFWPQFSQIILILIMFVGGMSASTSGSIKVSRLEVLFKDVRNKFDLMLHPKAIRNVQIEGNSIKPNKIEKVYLFIILYIFVFTLAGLILTADGNSIATSFTAVAATLGNVGPGLDSVGPFDNFAHFSVFSKLILSFCMLVGRLEIWTVVLLFSQYFWSI
jgi:trk system potassium uptake protein TrkH